MSRGSEILHQAGVNIYDNNRAAFSFLEDCLESTFDLTSAEAINPEEGGILLPPKILGILEEKIDFKSLSRFRGSSRGEDFALQECVNFFGEHGIPCGIDNVSLTNGILSSLSAVYSKIGLNESRKILVPTPTFGYYFQQFQEQNIGFSTLNTSKENNFLPNPEELEKAIVESGAVALLLCYPNNPTGAVMTEECARAISEITKRHNVFVISDEAFLSNSLSENKHFSIAAIPEMRDRSFTVTSPAKSMYIGQTIGLCVSRPDIISSFTQLGGYPTKQSQRLVTTAIKNSAENQEYLGRCCDYYLRNIDLVESKLTELNAKFSTQFVEEKDYVKPFISRPDATNVYLLDFSGLRGKKYGDKIMDTGLDAAQWLLREASVGTVPGECFLFDEKTMLVRIALNSPPHELALAFDSMIAATNSITPPSRAPSPFEGSRVSTSAQKMSGGAGIEDF